MLNHSTTKFISSFCFQVNKETYKQIVDYLNVHKQSKGQKDIDYNDLWPDFIDDPKLRSEIQNLPTDIMRKLNKDLSQAYNLIVQNLLDPSLKKLFRYDLIRVLYQFVTQIILKQTNPGSSKKKEKRQPNKQGAAQKNFILRNIQKSKQLKESRQQKKAPPSQWSSVQERYLCVLYMERSILKCSQKMKEKFGQNQKWNTSKKIFEKAQQIFDKSLKKAIKSNQVKELIQSLGMNKQNLAAEIIKRKSIQIQKIILRYYKSKDPKKKGRHLGDLVTQVPILLQNQEKSLPISQQKVEGVLKKQENEEQTSKQDQIKVESTQDSSSKVKKQKQDSQNLKQNESRQIIIDP